MRILIIGLDGGTWQVLQPLIERGVTPYLGKLTKEGASGVLKSTIPPLTSVAWTSFQTGVLPGKHGVYGFQIPSPTSKGLKFKVANSLSIKTSTLWDYLGQLGKKVGIVNLPMTYPPTPINGFLITGFPTPSQHSAFTYPQSLKEELLQMVPDYKVPTPEAGQAARGNQVERYVQDLIHMARSRVEATQFLMNKYEWDLMVLQLQETDLLQHPLWHYLDSKHPHFSQRKHKIVIQLFQEIDRLIKELSQELSKDDLLLIVSDHGFQAMRKVFSPNRWFKEQGYLKVNRTPSSFLYRSSLNILRFLDPFKLRRILISDNKREQLAQASTRRVINWDQSSVYAESAHTGDFNIYLIREDQKVLEDIIKKLHQVKDPETGESVVKETLTAREAFGKELTDNHPDLVVRLKLGYISVSQVTPNPNDIFESRKPGQDYQIGVHHPEGIIMSKGPMIKQGWDEVDAELIDIAPTILYHLGLPIPRYMDGKILQEMYTSKFLKGREAQFIEVEPESGNTRREELSVKEKQQVRNHLRDLGYLD